MRRSELSDQLLATAATERFFRLAGGAVRCFETFPKHAARGGQNERERGQQKVYDEKTNDVRTGLWTGEDVGLKAHIERPQRSEYEVGCHKVNIFLG